MLKRERLAVGFDWLFKSVPQNKIEMESYFHKCGTPSCALGHMTECPALIEDNMPRPYLTQDEYLREFNRKYMPREDICLFFNLTKKQYKHLFGASGSGKFYHIKRRLQTVLKQSGPFPEPELENLEIELQQLIEKETVSC